MPIDLVKKRAAIQADHEGKQQFDRMYWQPLAEAGDKLADRPVAFQCDDEIVAIGDDVAAIYAGLEKFAETILPAWEKIVNEPLKAMAVSKVKRLLAGPQPDELRLGTQVWNCCLAALKEVGVQVCVSDGSQD
jgi:hypothetical protein